MIELNKTIVINAPLKKIFGYIREISNLSEIWPSLMQVEDIQKLPDGSASFRWTYNMAGIRMHGTGGMEYVINQSITIKTIGDIKSTQIWTLKLAITGTRVTVHMEYGMPIPVLGKFAEVVVAKMNDQEGDLVMANLKVRMET